MFIAAVWWFPGGLQQLSG